MVERSLSMREVPGSIPGASKVFQFANIFVCLRMEMDGFYDISCLNSMCQNQWTVTILLGSKQISCATKTHLKYKEVHTFKKSIKLLLEITFFLKHLC